MLHSYGQGKGDIKRNCVTSVKYESLEVKKRATVWFNLLFLSVEEICFWLFADVHLLEQNKGRVTLTCRFTFHMPPISRCQSLLCIFSCNKKSCWHAACLRGVIHHYRKKGITEWKIQRDFCAHYFNFCILSIIKTPVGSRKWYILQAWS